LEKALVESELDSSNGVNFPYYDQDTKMIYLVGKVSFVTLTEKPGGHLFKLHK
jgi:hypothetical protein